ncbi:3-dehydroquinate synthase [Salimicrobium flavidum]|uniref:3-dehydroquinate synthase n=1 Tax=Salimicrobium flavidum TaxID=570947 RepID=A0A1N7IJA8_9BACI|nr:3-dehydroquinate synthase [Salimicrobium flavidum]SIS37142.1 3-dehydroquinate synthase [Salimicrobium flavidum]
MDRLQVHVPGKTYEVILSDGLRHQLDDYIEKAYSSVLIIADQQVADLYLNDITNSLKDREQVFQKVIPAGESSKSFEWYKKLLDYCVECRLDRKSLIIALGGGMIGDLAGFVAASYLRGVSFIQLPTSILAHDSSVGGKVAINHEEGKNLIGAFYHPDKVLYDTETIRTLPLKEKRSGYGEVVKHALLSDEGWFSEVVTRRLDSLSSEEVRADLIRGIELKASIVERDEKESDVRKHLNLGHTLAHAIEAELHYHSLTHGEAVVIGTLFALHVSGLNDSYQKLLEWAKDNDYPLDVMADMDVHALVDRMKMDKKAEKGQINYVLMEGVGLPYVTRLDEKRLVQSLKHFKSEVRE